MWSREIPQKILTQSVQPFRGLLDTNKQTDKPNLYMLPIKHRPVRTKQKIIATAGYLKINFNKFWNKEIHYYLCNICFVLLLHEYVIHEVNHKWWDFNNDLKLFNYNDLRVESWNYADCLCLEDTLNDLIKKKTSLRL